MSPNLASSEVSAKEQKAYWLPLSFFLFQLRPNHRKRSLIVRRRLMPKNRRRPRHLSPHFDTEAGKKGSCNFLPEDMKCFSVLNWKDTDIPGVTKREKGLINCQKSGILRLFYIVLGLHFSPYIRYTGVQIVSVVDAKTICTPVFLLHRLVCK